MPILIHTTEEKRAVALFSALVQRAGVLPGVESAAVVSRGLFTGRLWPNVVEGEHDGVRQRGRADRAVRALRPLRDG